MNTSDVTHPGRGSGFSLLEALVALAVFGLAVVVAANALTAHAATVERNKVRQHLLRTAETAVEGLRGGLLPLVSDRMELGREFRAPDLRVYVSIDVTDRDLEGLHEVSVRASVRLPGRQETVTLETMVWRPP